MQIVTDAVHSVLSFSSDVIVIAILIGLGTAYALISGKRRATSLILSFYPTAVIFRFLPFFKQYTASNPANATEAFTLVVIFLVILVPIHLILNQFIATDFHFSNVRKILESFVFGIITASLAVLFSYQIVNLKMFYNFGTGIDALFSTTTVFYWLILPFVLLFFVKE